MGNGASFPGYSLEAESWRQVTYSDGRKCAPALVLQMGSTARDVCMAAGNDKLLEADAATTLLSVLRDYFAPDGMDAT